MTLLGQETPPEIADAARLTRFAAATRYPGVAEPVTAEEQIAGGRSLMARDVWDPCHDAVNGYRD